MVMWHKWSTLCLWSVVACSVVFFLYMLFYSFRYNWNVFFYFALWLFKYMSKSLWVWLGMFVGYTLSLSLKWSERHHWLQLKQPCTLSTLSCDPQEHLKLHKYGIIISRKTVYILKKVSAPLHGQQTDWKVRTVGGCSKKTEGNTMSWYDSSLGEHKNFYKTNFSISNL